jgi:acetone carboxylase gamma subunit
VSVSLRIKDGRWQCTSCHQDLGEEDGNWREAAVTRETEVFERFRELHSRVRPRRAEPPVVIREHFCPGCASSLTIDVTLGDREPVEASRVGVKQLLQAAP